MTTFDYFGLPEEPQFILCNPDKSELYALGEIYNKEYKPRYNAFSEISFTADSIIDGEETEYFDLLTYRRIIYFIDIGYFMISDVEINDNGEMRAKEIVAKSLEVEMVLKNLTNLTGTYKFYDFLTPGPTLIGSILAYLPGWSIGSVDASLAALYRTFDGYNGTIYDFLMTETEEAFQNIFTFDTVNKRINAYTIDSATSSSDIFLSFDNLVEDVTIKEITDEITTALNVYGGGDLSVNQVNPLGTDTIYNFDYYKTTEWMSDNLIDAVVAWETIVDDNQSDYADLLTVLLAYNTSLITLNSELVTLQGELLVLEGVQSVKIQQGLSISAINIEINAKKTEITSKSSEITAMETLITNVTIGLTDINTTVSCATNFTDDQLTELSPYIVGNTYQNNNFIQTDTMTLVEIQEMAQDLYDQAVAVLTKVSSPRYEFSISAVNFMMLEEFSTFSDQLQMGSIVTFELEEDVFIYPALLGYDLNYEDPTDFTLIFGNRLRLDGSDYSYSDLFGDTVKSSMRTTFESLQWSNFDTNYKDDVSTFIDSALDAAKNSVISSSAQDIIFDQNGIRIRKTIGEGTFDPKQIWMNNGIIAFTDDNWDSAKLALGAIEFNGSTLFGLVGEIIVGRVVASNQLTITNENNTFIVDGSGATLTDASFTILKNNSKIVLDPIEGISISKKISTGTGWEKNFYIDTYGNLVFAGNLSGASGTFSGAIEASSGKIGAWTIDAYGLKDDSGNYIYGDGRVRLGALQIDGNTATFYGDIYANNLQGYVYGEQLRNINADYIDAGTIRGINIYGTNIYGSNIEWAGVKMTSSGFGISLLEVENSLVLRKGNGPFSEIGISENGIYMASLGGRVQIGDSNEPSIHNLFLYGSIYTNDYKGITGTFLV